MSQDSLSVVCSTQGLGVTAGGGGVGAGGGGVGAGGVGSAGSHLQRR